MRSRNSAVERKCHLEILNDEFPDMAWPENFLEGIEFAVLLSVRDPLRRVDT